MEQVERTNELRRGLEARPTGELVSILRNQDAEEWQPEVFEIVASILSGRGVSPEEVVALGPEGYDVVEGQRLVTLARCFSAVEAHLQRLALREAGIQAWVSDEVLGSIYGVGIGNRLQVRVEDEAAARAALASAPVLASDLPPELAEPPCPSCHSGQVTQAAGLPASSPFPAGLPRRVWQYRCESCGHSWSD